MTEDAASGNASDAWTRLTSGDPNVVATAQIWPTDWEELLRRGFRKNDLQAVLKDNGLETTTILIDASGFVKLAIVDDDWQVVVQGTLCEVFFGSDFTARFDARVMRSPETVERVEEALLAWWKFLSLDSEVDESVALMGNKTHLAKIRIKLYQRREETSVDVSPIVCNALNNFIAWRAQLIHELVENLNLEKISLQPSCYVGLLSVETLCLENCSFVGPPSPALNGINTCTKSVFLFGDMLFQENQPTLCFQFLERASKLTTFFCPVPHSRKERLLELLNPFWDTFGEQLWYFQVEGRMRLPEEAAFMISIFLQTLSRMPRLMALHLIDRMAYPEQSEEPMLSIQEHRTVMETTLSRHVCLLILRFLDSAGVDCMQSFTMVPAILDRNYRFEKVKQLCQEILAEGNDGIKVKLLKPMLRRCQDWPLLVYEILHECRSLIVSTTGARSTRKRRLHHHT